MSETSNMFIVSILHLVIRIVTFSKELLFFFIKYA